MANNCGPCNNITTSINSWRQTNSDGKRLIDS